MKSIFKVALKYEKILKQAEWEDHISGGKADEKEPDDFNREQLEKGQEVEMEHTDDPEKAKEIAMDHLEEHSDYYIGLEHLEKMLEEIEE